MASFYAELEVEGQTYPVRWCRFGFEQATHERGRVRGKVRHGLLHLTLDVPDGDHLLAWANTANKALAGHVTFFETNRLTARETVSFAAGQCVGYDETFASGDGTGGAYVCRLVIATDKLELTPGGPPRPFTPAAARDYATTPVEELVAAAAPLLPNKLQRYTARLNMMQSARTKLSTDPNDLAQNALSRLELNNVAVERARLSGHVYHSDEIPPVEAPEGWHMFDPAELAQLGVSPEMLLDPKSGFKAALYQSNFEQTSKIVAAYAGTEDGKDIMADLRQGIGREDKQYNEAMDLAKALVKSVGQDNIDVTGHSLGGGLASAAAVVAGVKGYTFNAAGLHANTVSRAPYEVSRAAMQEQASLIDAFRSTSDPLNNFQNALSIPKGFVAPKALGIPHAVTPAPQWQHQWSELVKGNPLNAVKSLALDGHGIFPQMVDHIEHEKDQDTSTLTNYLGQ